MFVCKVISHHGEEAHSAPFTARKTKILPPSKSLQLKVGTSSIVSLAVGVFFFLPFFWQFSPFSFIQQGHKRKKDVPKNNKKPHFSSMTVEIKWIPRTSSFSQQEKSFPQIVYRFVGRVNQLKRVSRQFNPIPQFPLSLCGLFIDKLKS